MTHLQESNSQSSRQAVVEASSTRLCLQQLEHRLGASPTETWMTQATQSPSILQLNTECILKQSTPTVEQVLHKLQLLQRLRQPKRPQSLESRTLLRTQLLSTSAMELEAKHYEDKFKEESNDSSFLFELK